MGVGDSRTRYTAGLRTIITSLLYSIDGRAGVRFRGGKFYAKMKHAGTTLESGPFNTDVEAAHAYDKVSPATTHCKHVSNADADVFSTMID